MIKISSYASTLHTYIACRYTGTPYCGRHAMTALQSCIKLNLFQRYIIIIY